MKNALNMALFGQTVVLNDPDRIYRAQRQRSGLDAEQSLLGAQLRASPGNL